MNESNPQPSHVMCAPAESREAASTISVAATPAIVDGIAKHKRKRETLEQLFGRLLDRRTARELASIGQRRKSLTARIAHRIAIGTHMAQQ